MWSVLSVSSHMLGQMSLESFVTNHAKKRLDILVQTLQVFLQSVPTHKSAPADLAFVILLSIVPLHVNRQIRRAREHPRTKSTAVRFDLAVSASVLRQLASSRKRLVAFVALVRAESCVGAHVQLQSLLQRELLTAFVALEGRSGAMHNLVMVPKTSGAFEFRIAHHAAVLLVLLILFLVGARFC